MKITPNKEIVVLAPDKAAGEDFAAVLKRSFQNSNIEQEVSLEYVVIPPRVIGNKLTTEYELIQDKLIEEFNDLINQGYAGITISCNTLSLPVFTEAVKNKFKDKIKIRTTIDAIVNFAKTEKDPVLLIGTKAFIDNFPYKNYVEVFQEDDELDLCQEIVWRTKSYQGSSVSTAFNYPDLNDKDKNLSLLIQCVIQLVNLVKKYQFKKIIMGCTEMPAAISLLSNQEIGNLVFIDPAALVAKELIKS